MASKRKEDSVDADYHSSQSPKKKQLKRSQSFRKEYTEKWPFIRPGKKGDTFAFCDVCATDFSVRSGGRDDCRRHIVTEKHKGNAKLREKEGKNIKITGFFSNASTSVTSAESSLDMDVMRAEVMIVDLVTELNLPMASLDRFTKAVQKVFKDSAIAKRFQCGRSKGTAVMKELAATTSLDLGQRMKNGPFTVSTDGSNDRGSSKLFPLVIRTVEPQTLEVRSDVLAVPACEGSATGEAIFRLIENEIEVHHIPWENCLAFGSDNANVMVGRKKGVYGHLLEKHPKMYLSGCVCHLIHIAAEKGAACLPLSVDQLLIEVYYYLDKSSKRQGVFKDIQLLHDLKQDKILKHVSTRWLSIGKCLPRLLENWNALCDFFKTEESNAVGSAEKEKTGRLRRTFKSPTNRLYCMFLLDVIQVYERINTELQSEEPKLHIMRARLHCFLKELFVRFVKPSAMVYKQVLDVDFKTPCNIRENSDLIIGDSAREFIAKAKEVNLRAEKVTEFYASAKQFFKESCSYIKTKLPMTDELLEHAQVLDPAKQSTSKFSSLEYFLKRFPKLKSPEVTVTDIQLEFAKYQCTDIRKCILDTERIDATWSEIGKLQEEDEPIFKLLPRIMVSVLIIPHSSAHCERIFSIVRKNQTDFRGRMGHETLEALVVAKSRPRTAVEREYSKSQLCDLKSAYYRSLQSS